MTAERGRNPVCLLSMFVVALSLSASLAEAQAARRPAMTGRIIKDAPLLLTPDARGPLLIMEAGVMVEVHRREGNWVNVTVEGSQFGRRTGYVDARLIEVLEAPATEAPPRVTVASTIPPTSAVAPTSNQTTGVQLQPAVPAREPLQNSLARGRPIATTETFQSAKINITVEDKTRESDVTVRYDPNALVIADRKTGGVAKSFPYAEIKGAEYSFAKNPRWKTAIFVSPLFLFTSGKKHWFLVQGNGDYALLHLDKSNYRLILAAFEARTGLRVETVADTK